MLKKLKGSLAILAIVCLTLSTLVIQVSATETELSDRNNEDYYSHLQKLTLQVQKEDHAKLNEKVTWKFKWVIFADVTFNQTVGMSVHRTLSADDQLYARVIAQDFKNALETANPNVKAEMDLEIYQTPIQVETSNNDFLIHESQIADILEEKIPYGAYDSIFVVSESQNGGGATKAAYYSDVTRGAAFSTVGLSTISADNYPEHSVNRDIEYSTEIALHEFCHQMEMAGLIDTYPNVHGSSSYGYTNDPQNGWMQFYLDYLTGKIHDPNTGKLIGIYPEMWRLTPRYLKAITPPVRGATWIYKPGNTPNQRLDGIEKIHIPIDYKNAFGSPWLDINFLVGFEKIDSTRIQSSNTKVAEVLNFDSNVARIKIVGTGQADILFNSKDGSFTYTKKIQVYDENATSMSVNNLFEDGDTLKPIKKETNQQTIDSAQKLIDMLPENLAIDYQQTVDRAQKELDERGPNLTRPPRPTLPKLNVDSKIVVVNGLANARITLVLPDGTQISKTANADGETTFNLFSLQAGDIIAAFQTLNGVRSEAATTLIQAGLLEAPRVNNYYIQDTYVLGVISEGTKRIALMVNGKVARYGEVAQDGTYKIYARDVLSYIGQKFTVLPVDIDGVRGHESEGVVKDKVLNKVSAPTIDSYYLRTSYVTGIASEGTKRIALVVNGEIARYGEVTKEGTYKIYARDVLSSIGQKFTVLPFNTAGISGYTANATAR